MSSKEAEREEMNEETHEVEDMAQDELDEEEDVSDDEQQSWLHEHRIDKIVNTSTKTKRIQKMS